MIEQYICQRWDQTVRTNKEEKDGNIGLPYPYTVPCISDAFQCMFYWDTFFTCKGLELTNRWELVKSNTDNILYMVEKFGYMPNGTNVELLDRSQMPFLSLMVKDVYEHYQDKAWLKSAYKTLVKEHQFWVEQRSTPIGLAQFGGTYNGAIVDSNYESFVIRVNKEEKDWSKEGINQHFLACAESGWDFNPRWEFQGYNYVQVELNSLLFQMEENIAFFSQELGLDETPRWTSLAKNRQEKANTYLWNEERKRYYDYNFASGQSGKVYSAASLFPLFSGMASKEQAQATVEQLHRIELDYGITCCEKNDSGCVYQWDYPNGWPPLQLIAMVGLQNYGFDKEAYRIAKKYVDLVERVFEATGCLWEKYNVLEGNVEVINEYEMPPMIGWSAGVYLFAKNMCK
ncbi:trehalase family glycosidase [Lachnoclostridium sp.]|nr:trehalase family glycosidase [Lachnoclostridium sp.]